jgi:DNA-binding LacI/PurR family transcriptional regulator
MCDAQCVQEAMEKPSGTRPRSASIRDVARLAGVSHQTVSRVLNGHPSIRDVTKSRVLAAMDEIKFRPSRAARMLSMRRSETIGVLAAAVGSHYGPASSVSAVEDAARERGFYATVAHLASVAPSAISAAIEDLLTQEVEGIVIVAPRTSVLSRLAALSMDVPIVAAQGEQRGSGGIPVVSVDQEAGVRMLLGYLIGQGHQRILHVAGPPDWNDAQSRLRAYKEVLEGAGLAWWPPLYGDWTADSGYEIGRALARDIGGASPALPFTAVFSSNDQMALGLIHALREAGLDVPGDVSVVGFDDIPESAHFWPPLTTVRQDFSELGARCVSTLIDAIRRAEDPLAPDGIGAVSPVEPRLVVRASVAAVEQTPRLPFGIKEGSFAPHDGVDQLSDLSDRDADLVAWFQGERQVGDQAGAGGQHHAGREIVLREQVAGQFVDPPPQARRARRSVPGHRVVAADRQPDGEGIRVGHLPHRPDPRADRAGAQVDLGLRQVQRVLAFNGARAHVVADGVADDFGGVVEHDRQFRFGHVDFRVGPHRHRAARSGHTPGRRLEEQLGPGRVVHPVVDVGGILALGHPRRPRPLVGHPGRPHLGPPVDRGEQAGERHRGAAGIRADLAHPAQRLGQQVGDGRP